MEAPRFSLQVFRRRTGFKGRGHMSLRPRQTLLKKLVETDLTQEQNTRAMLQKEIACEEVRVPGSGLTAELCSHFPEVAYDEGHRQSRHLFIHFLYFFNTPMVHHNITANLH